jgi:hypothetical protein
MGSGRLPVVAIRVACIACSRTFDAVQHAGLVRCSPCEESQAFSFPSAGPTVTTIDTPGEAWA